MILMDQTDITSNNSKIFYRAGGITSGEFDGEFAMSVDEHIPRYYDTDKDIATAIEELQAPS